LAPVALPAWAVAARSLAAARLSREDFSPTSVLRRAQNASTESSASTILAAGPLDHGFLL
jgi:hypothetical protein